MDSIGLASSSLGWEARAHLNVGHHADAIDCYLEQQAAGKLDSVSLKTVAWAALKLPPDELELLAARAHSRQVITISLMALSQTKNAAQPSQEIASRKWLQAVSQAGVPSVNEADQLALIAYKGGHFQLAKDWLQVAPEDSVAAHWLQGKLLLRTGDISDATASLSRATQLMSQNSDAPRSSSFEWVENTYVPEDREGSSRGANQIQAELGVLRLRGREFTEACSLFLSAGYWADAAYLAERVLTTEELKDYLDRTWPVSPRNEDDSGKSMDENSLRSLQSPGATIRYLLARRLAREGAASHARPYYPREWRPAFDQWQTALIQANDPSLPEDQRAEAFWTAAKLLRHSGMELTGTELDPDWHVVNGAFNTGGPKLATRMEAAQDSVFAPTQEEIRRVNQSAPNPDRRYHYRYRAAELAWQAAQLLPAQSPTAAEILCTAGTWHKLRDPAYADRFYKALVTRCGQTGLGKAAANHRWFPSLEGRENHQ